MSVFPSSKATLLGDFEFIQSKVLDGDFFQISGDINNLNDTIEFIVPDLRTAFLIEAKIVITGHTNPPDMNANTQTTTSDRVQAELKIDGAVKDTTNIGIVSSMAGDGIAGGEPSGGAGYGTIGDGRFNVVGLSLLGTVLGEKIEIENILDNGSAIATMSGYLV